MTEKKTNKKLKRRMIGTFVKGVFFANIVIGSIANLLAYNLLHQHRDIIDKGFLTRANQFTLYFIITAAIIIIILGIILYSRVYTDIISRLNTISEATVKISNGELDFTLTESDHKDEIDELCRDFENMRKRLRETLLQRLRDEEENRKLISNITHDLKTPITSIKGYAEGLLDGIATTKEKQDKYLQTICSKSEELNRLLNELTYYTQIEQSSIPYNFENINISLYLNDIIEETRLDLEATNIQLNYTRELLEDTLIIADRSQLHKVINNILGNSVKYMDKPNPEINVKLTDSDDFVYLEFKDNGCGIPTHSLPYIFDRFYRSDEARSSSTGGSGIGLSIVKRIIDDHGGRIWAASTPGEYTSIHIELRKYHSLTHQQ